MSREIIRRTAVTLGVGALVELALTACLSKAPAATSDNYPDWAQQGKPLCAVTLGPIFTSLADANREVSHLDPRYNGNHVLIGGQSDNIGMVINLNGPNAKNPQSPGDIALFGGVTRSVCIDPQVNGQYAVRPYIPAPGQ